MYYTQRTGPASPGARPMDVEEANLYSGWSQRAISLRDIMNHECTTLPTTPPATNRHD